MKKNIYIIDCLTNMHVGSGETNFNIVDNQVQRDSVTEFPTINSSSLKGALRDFAEGFEVENVVADGFGEGVAVVILIGGGQLVAAILFLGLLQSS